MPRRSPGGSLILLGRSPGGSLILLGRSLLLLGSRREDRQSRREDRREDRCSCWPLQIRPPEISRSKDDPSIALPYGISPYIPSERITRSRDRSKLRPTCILMNITSSYSTDKILESNVKNTSIYIKLSIKFAIKEQLLIIYILTIGRLNRNGF